MKPKPCPFCGASKWVEYYPKYLWLLHKKGCYLEETIISDIWALRTWDKRVKEKVANEDQEFPGILR